MVSPAENELYEALNEGSTFLERYLSPDMHDRMTAWLLANTHYGGNRLYPNDQQEFEGIKFRVTRWLLILAYHGHVGSVSIFFCMSGIVCMSFVVAFAILLHTATRLSG